MATTTGFTYAPALASLAEAGRLLQEAYNIVGILTHVDIFAVNSI